MEPSPLTREHFYCPKSLSISPPALGNHLSTLSLPILDTHIHQTMQYMAFCFRLLSFSILFSRFIRALASISTSLLFIGNILLHRYTAFLCSTYSSVDGHLGCFHLLANKKYCYEYKCLCGHMSSVSIRYVDVFLLGIYPGVELLGHMATL